MSSTIDRVILTAALGVSFWDVAGGRFVSDGLTVSAYPAARQFDRVSGVANHSGVFVFHRLPASPPFVVEVRDDASRFLAVSFAVDAPVESLFVFRCEPGQAPRAAVPLFSAPGRRPPPGQAAVCAQFQLTGSGNPAAWAVLELDVPGHPNAARGIADAQGRVAVHFPYPEPAGLPIGSPGAASGPPLAQQSWAVRARARYGALPLGGTPPDLCAVLNQPPAALWVDATASAPLGSANLMYGRELVLRSLGAAGQPPLPVVLISPAGSPP